MFLKRFSKSILILTAIQAILFTACYQKVQRNEINIGSADSIKSMNPILGNRNESQNFWRLLYQPLVDFDLRNNKAVPVLAVDLPIVTYHDSTNTYSLRFEIKNEAVWDNGLPVTTRDVAFTFKLLKMFDTQNSYALTSELKEIVFTNDIREFTLIIQADSNKKYVEEFDVPILPEYFFDPSNLLFEKNFKELQSFKQKMPNEELQKWYDHFLSLNSLSSETVCGSGAYQLTDKSNQNELLLTRKPDWWGNAFNTADELIFFQAYPARLHYFMHLKSQMVLKNISEFKLDVYENLTKTDFKMLKENSDWEKDFVVTNNFIYNKRLTGIETSASNPGFWEGSFRTTLK